MRPDDLCAMRRIGLTLLFVLGAACRPPRLETAAHVSHAPSSAGRPHGPPDWWHSRVTIENRSHWSIHQLFLTPFDATSWGDDQLGPDDQIATGRSLELRGIDCDSYDVKLVDEDGDECIVQDVDLCLEDAKWVVNDKDLVLCQRKTAARAGSP